MMVVTVVAMVVVVLLVLLVGAIHGGVRNAVEKSERCRWRKTRVTAGVADV
jgi:uncharacterized membrane protein